MYFLPVADEEKMPYKDQVEKVELSFNEVR